jgi:glycosyltransferase involved in cell wall biosynthesis
MPPRILHIGSGTEWRGGERQLLLLARGLRDRGAEPLIVAPPGSQLVQRLRRAGIATSSVSMRADWDLVAVRRIRSLMRTWTAELIHAHDPRAHALALVALLDRPRTQLVVTRRIPQPPRGIRHEYSSRVARFIATSRTVRETLVAAGVDPARVDLVYPGVPIPTVHEPRDWRVECRWPADAVICGVVGAGGDSAGSLLGSIADRLPLAARQRARLLIFGGAGTGHCVVSGVEAFRAGVVDEIQPALAGADLLLHLATTPSLGTAVIDAMALGVPPIAFAVSTLAELIETDRTGILVPAADVDVFARATAEMVLSDSRRLSLAVDGPARAARFSVEAMVSGIEETYRTVLALPLPATHASSKPG